jgi:succinoglycan biosynthesis transport protein ExoP
MVESNHNINRYVRPEMSAGYPSAMERHAGHQAQLSIADIARTIAKRKFLILGFTLLTFCTMAIYVNLKTPLYEGIARVQIDPMRSSSLGLDDADKSESTDIDGRVKTEVEIIQSNTVAMQVMNSLGLYANPEFAGPDTVSSPIKGLFQLPAPLRRRLLDRFDSSLIVRVVPSTQIVEIRFRSPDPVLATKTANSIIEEYMQRNFQTRVDGSAQVSQWLSGQMEEIKASTAISQQKLADFQRDTNLLGSNESDNIVTDRLKQLNEELTQAEADRIVKEGRYRLAGSGNPELVGSTVSSTTLQTLHTQQADLDAQYAQLSAKYGSGYPKLGELELQLSGLSSAIDSERTNIKTRLANEYDAAAKAEAMIRADFEKQKTEAYSLNEHATQYALLKREVESGQQLYDTLQLKVKEAGVTSGLKSSYVNVIDRAQLPDVPVEPRRKFYLAAGLGGGLFGGFLLGLILESFDDTIETSKELEAVTALPQLGSVPFLAPRSGKGQRGVNLMNPLGLKSEFDPISIREPNCLGAEAYRSLCSVILLSPARTPPQVLVVTSAMPGEGKSTVSCNLATALAQRAKRVLLVDADMRCSSIHGEPGTGLGLSTMLAEGPSAYLRYQPLDDLPNLKVVPPGCRPPGSTEILASPHMQELMAIWRAEYDHIIIDTPPLLPFADALLLSAMADGVILVARSEVSQNKALLRARDVLARTGANILGVVLNAVKRPEFDFAYSTQYKQVTSSNHKNVRADNSKATASGQS